MWQMDQIKESCQPTDEDKPRDEPQHFSHSILGPQPHTGPAYSSAMAQAEERASPPQHRHRRAHPGAADAETSMAMDEGGSGVLALSEPRSLSPAMGLILSRLHKLGNSLKYQSAVLQNQTSQQPLAAEGRDIVGVWITSFYPQNEFEQILKLQKKILKTAGNSGRDLWSPPQHREPQQGC